MRYTRSMEDSVFTKIIKGEIPCYKIYEDDKVIAFLDVHPQMPGHVLVVPKKQVDHLWDLRDDDYEYLWRVVKKIGTHIKTVLDCPRVGVVVEGFGVPHVHVHLMPIYQGADLKRPQDTTSPIDHEALSSMAKKLAMNTL